MPNLEAEHIPIWITECRILPLQNRYTVSTDSHENCLIRFRGARCTAECRDRTVTLTDRSVIMLGRNTAVTVTGENGTSPECQLLRYAHTYTTPYLDLNHLCTTISLVDAFLGRKNRFCVIDDSEFICFAMGLLQDEWTHDRPEKDMMLETLLYQLFIKLARAFSVQNQVTGLHFLNTARRFILVNYSRSISLDDVAKAAGISRSYLTILFKQHMNRTVVEYIQSVRCDRAAYLLGTTQFPVIDIAIDTGFNSRQHFTRTFSRLYGLTPHEYRRTFRPEASGLTPFRSSFTHDTDSEDLPDL